MCVCVCVCVSVCVCVFDAQLNKREIDCNMCVHAETTFAVYLKSDLGSLFLYLEKE